MKYDEFAFFNQQLGAMLRDGIPLEGALRQLCSNMERGQLRTELELLGADLQGGTPLKTALAARKLPDFYSQMVEIGARSNDLPGVLLMLADYYRRVDSIWTRLKGLMVYPLMVLIAAFALSCLFGYLGIRLFFSSIPEMSQLLEELYMGYSPQPAVILGIFIPPVLIGALLAFWVIFLSVPAVNRAFRWRLPAFRDAKLAQLASGMQMMLKSGENLDDAIGLLQKMELGSPAGPELAKWKSQLAGGRGKFTQMAVPGKVFPPMFIWLVANAGEDLAGGFQSAAEIYDARAINRIEMFLYAALPAAILGLGVLIICQILPMLRIFGAFLNGVGGGMM
ncbi:MAG TPA: type II secretion system F family protein [Verrucomicrobiae bacterium]|jgi:type IV pilus assembly protein PilC|nr:type II secretion system F family protein [Verrucomicrobiae bacterium]